MFTDIVGSTEMTAQLGDTMAVELLRAHDAIIRRCLEHHRGSEVKHLGDGIMASFVDAPASVACAIEIQEELASYNEASETPIRVRIGIHATMSVNMIARKAESSIGIVFAEGGSWMRPRKASTADRSTAIISLATCPWASAWTLSAVSLSGASTRP